LLKNKEADIEIQLCFLDLQIQKIIIADI